MWYPIKLISTKELKPGMILGRDIKSTSEDVAIPKGSVLSDSLIDFLIWNKVEFVVIESESNDFDLVARSLHSQFTRASISKPIDALSIRSSLAELVRISSTKKSTLQSFRNLKSSKDYIIYHSIRVCLLCLALGKWLELSKPSLKSLALAALLHDIGMSKIPKEILNKTSMLSRDEYSMVKEHCRYGFEIVDNNPSFSKDVALAVLQHHERSDGSGYPMGRQIEETNLLSRIIAVADVFDAITSSKVYRLGKNEYVALEIVKELVSKGLDGRIVKVFADNLNIAHIGDRVILKTDEIGEIVYIDDYSQKIRIRLKDNKYIETTKDENIIIEDVII